MIVFSLIMADKRFLCQKNILLFYFSVWPDLQSFLPRVVSQSFRPAIECPGPRVPDRDLLSLAGPASQSKTGGEPRCPAGPPLSRVGAGDGDERDGAGRARLTII